MLQFDEKVIAWLCIGLQKIYLDTEKKITQKFKY